MNASIINDMNDPEFRKLLAEEELILEVTETICDLLATESVSRKELAERLGKTKGFVSQLLNGGRNLTLRTVADILYVLGYKISLNYQKEEKQKRKTNVIEFPTTYQKIQQPIHEELEFSSKANNYSFIKKAISS